jgi:4-oxalocrotonate tautomerase
MPEVVVYAVEGRTFEQKKALVQDITAAVVKNFKVEADAVTIQFVEAKKTDKAKGGVMFSERGPAR